MYLPTYLPTYYLTWRPGPSPVLNGGGPGTLPLDDGDGACRGRRRAAPQGVTATPGPPHLLLLEHCNHYYYLPMWQKKPPARSAPSETDRANGHLISEPGLFEDEAPADLTGLLGDEDTCTCYY